jgi:hypothetical protein
MPPCPACGGVLNWRLDPVYYEVRNAKIASLEAAQIGMITAERARELLNQPEIPEGSQPIDPLDVVIDGLTLRELLTCDEIQRLEYTTHPRPSWTPAQRAAVSAHWSAQLRAKIEASKVKERNQVMMPLDAEDCEW